MRTCHFSSAAPTFITEEKIKKSSQDSVYTAAGDEYSVKVGENESKHSSS